MIRNVIIGNSAAGLTALETIRKSDHSSEITMISYEKGPAYSKVLLPYFISGRVDRSNLLIASDEYYRRLEAITIFGKMAVHVDTKNQRILLDDGETVPYDHLIICTGALPDQLNVEGSGIVPVKSLRTLEDAIRIKELLRVATKVLVIGAGLINLTLVSLLKHEDFEFTVVLRGQQILASMLDRTAASILEKRMREFDISLHKGHRLNRIMQGNKGKPCAVFDNGLEIETDAVIFQTGTSPDIGLVSSSGITTRRGIVIDDYARTNMPNVYAAGDVTETRERISGEYANIGNWFNAVEQGKIASLSIRGESQRYEGCLHTNITDLFGFTVLSIGDFNGSSEGSKTITHADLERASYQKIVVREGNIIGGVFVNEQRNGGVFRSILGKRISDFRFSRIAHSKGSILFGELIIQS